MSLTRSIGRNTIIQFGGKFLGTILGALTLGIFQRYISPVGFGAYTTAMAYLGFLSVVADLGLYLVLVKELNKPGADESRVVGNLLGLRWASAAVVLGAGAAVIIFFPYTASVKSAVWIGTGSFIAIAATQLIVGIFQTKLAMNRVMIGELTGRIVLLASTWVVISLHGGLNSIMIAVVGGSLMNLLIVWKSASRWIPLRPRFEWPYWLVLLRDAWPIAISVVLNLIYFRIDTIFLSIFSSQYDVGLYGAAYKILEILNTFPIMFVGLLLPLLGRAFSEHDTDRFTMIFQRGFETIVLLALMVVVPGTIFASHLLSAIGGPAYSPAAPTLQLLFIAVFALFLNSLSGHAITMINRQRAMVWGYLSIAAVGVIAYLVLIPALSLRGAAIGTIITESLSALIGYIVVLRVMRFRLALGNLAKIVLAAGVMAATAMILAPSGWILAILASWAVYGGVLLLTKAVSIKSLQSIISVRAEMPSQLPPE